MHLEGSCHCQAVRFSLEPDHPCPFNLAEEQRQWFIGWEALRNYLDPPKPTPVVQGIREEMRYIHWAESPMTAGMYLQTLMEKEVDQEKFKVIHARSMARRGSRP